MRYVRHHRLRAAMLPHHATLLRDCPPYAAQWKDYVRSMKGELVTAGA
jgi:hypothetical protein